MSELLNNLAEFANNLFPYLVVWAITSFCAERVLRDLYLLAEVFSDFVVSVYELFGGKR